MADDEMTSSAQRSSHSARSARDSRFDPRAVLRTVAERVQETDIRLRSVLSGTVRVVVPEKLSFIVDAKSGSVTEGDGTADCTVTVSDANLGRIALGHLNPQIAILSGKVSVQGQANLAMYVFNLIAPDSSDRL